MNLTLVAFFARLVCTIQWAMLWTPHNKEDARTFSYSNERVFCPRPYGYYASDRRKRLGCPPATWQKCVFLKTFRGFSLFLVGLSLIYILTQFVKYFVQQYSPFFNCILYYELIQNKNSLLAKLIFLPFSGLIQAVRAKFEKSG